MAAPARGGRLIAVAAGGARRKQLGTLLRIRTLEEDLAKGALAKANAATRAAALRLEQTIELYEERVAPPEATDVADFRRRLAMNASAAAMVRGAERGVLDAHEAANSAREHVKAARVRSQGLERLVERVDSEAFAELLAADQRTAEESMAGRSIRGRR